MVVKLISINNRIAIYENVNTFKENLNEIELSYGKFKDEIIELKINNKYLKKIFIYADDYSLLQDKEIEKTTTEKEQEDDT